MTSPLALRDAAIRALLRSGFRISDLAALDLSDVATWGRDGWELTGYARLPGGSVPLGADALFLIDAYLDERLDGSGDDGPLFLSRKGAGRLTPRHVRRVKRPLPGAGPRPCGHSRKTAW